MSIKDGILDLPIKKYWFNQIKCGAKTHEYRNIDTWQNKLGHGRWARYTIVRFRQGQTVKSTDKNRVLYGKILSVKVIPAAKTDLRINQNCFDIEFELIKED